VPSSDTSSIPPSDFKGGENMAQEGKFVPYELGDMWGCWPNASAMKLKRGQIRKKEKRGIHTGRKR